jgi:uncharacterized protein YqfA (UPF0365 family)
MDRSQMLALLFALGGMVLLTAICLVSLSTVKPWFRALLMGAPVSALRVFAMKLRGHPPSLLIDAYVVLVHRKLGASLDDVESAYIAHRHQVQSSSDLIELVERDRAGTASPA